MMRATTTFRITVPHDGTAGFHMWFFPNGWRGLGPVERRDRRGYRQGKRRGYYSEWFVLACNNSACPGQAVVPVSFVIEHADALDPLAQGWSV